MNHVTRARIVCLSCIMVCLLVPAVSALTTVALPTNRYLRPVGWSPGSSIEFLAGIVQTDDVEQGVVQGTLANETYLRPWNNSATYAFAAGSVVRFERTGGVLTGYLARDNTIRVVYSSIWLNFRGMPAPVTFGYDGGVATGVLATGATIDGRSLPAGTMVSFSEGKLVSAVPWGTPGVPPTPGTTVPETKPPVPVKAPGSANWPGGFQDDSPPVTTTTVAQPQYRSYAMSSPSFSALLSKDYPRRNLHITLAIDCRKPGTVLDTVGINAAPVGAFAVQVDPSGRPYFQIYDPGAQSSARMGSGWHIITATSVLSPGVEAVVDIDIGDKEISIAVNGRVEKRVAYAATLSGKPVYIGDIPDDDSWGSRYTIHPAMTGSLTVRYFGVSTSGR